MIQANYSDRQSPQFRVLSEAQCHTLYLAALECLNRVGLEVHHAGAREIFAGAGAQVEGQRVYIPAHILQEALVTAPHAFTVWGRGGQQEMNVTPDRVYFGPGPSCTYFIDPQTRERRKARRGDAGLTARVCDALPNLDYVMGLSLFDDVTPSLSPVYEFAESLANTTKPVVAWANDPETLEDIYRIAQAAAGGKENLRRRPNFAFFASYDSPLRFPEEGTANLLWAADRGIPLIWIGGPTMGLESPFTGASALVLHAAAALAGLALAQLQRKGTPVVIGGIPAAMDLRTARPAYGSPELSLHAAAAADLARYLQVPFMGTAGASESKLLDAQAGAEIGIQLLMAALSGASLVHDLGFLDCADIGSLPLLVLIDEVIGMVKRITRGLEINPETIMLDLIEEVGPGKHFMTKRRSVALCRQEVWNPALLDRNPFQTWMEEGGQRLEDKVYEKLDGILEGHQPEPLAESVQQEIDLILTEAEERERKRG